jgi:steroid delta-isomerase-like uncharacterized protein
MSVETNKAIVRRYVEEYWNQGKLDLADEILATDFVFYEQTNPEMRGTEAQNQFTTAYRAGFPDIHFTVEDVIAEGDRVVNRWSCVGTHQGELMGIPPTGKQVTTTGISIYRIAGSKIAEEWVNWSTLSMLQQIGVVPQMGESEE